MKRLAFFFLVPCLAVFFVPANAWADGMFVVPKFVWDKHKDINEPTQKVIIVYDAGREDLILQVKYIPVFRQMLKDTNSIVCVSGMEMLYQLHVSISREQLLQFFKVPDREAISLVLAQLRNKNNSGMPDFINDGTGISDKEAIPLLQNTDPLARLIGLKILYKNAENQSVELAIPLLNDPESAVRLRTARTLRALTGQHFTDKQFIQWQEWWMASKTNFVVQVDPDELTPQPPDFRIDEISDRPPATPPKNLPH